MFITFLMREMKRENSIGKILEYVYFTVYHHARMKHLILTFASLTYVGGDM